MQQDLVPDENPRETPIGQTWKTNYTGQMKVQELDSIRELRAALDCINPLLKAFGAADTRAMERLLKIINAARDKYPL